MKKLALLMLFINFLPLVTASTIFDDWVNDRETFKAGDHYFYVQYIESNQNLVFKMDDIGGMMLMGECETRDDIKYCFEDIDHPRIKVKIESLEPIISIERTFSNTEPYLNDEIKVTVKLTNNGSKSATNVKYLDIYPDGLKVFSSKNAGEWDGNLNAGEEETFTYTIKAASITSLNSIATLSYNFDGKEKTKKSSTVTISVQKPYGISHEISKEAADRDEVVDYSLTITNKHGSDSLIIENLEISLPSRVDLVKAPSELKKAENRLIFKGTIGKEESKNFSIKIKSSGAGKFTINSILNLKTSNNNFKEELEKTFNVGLSYILPILNITEEIKSNLPYHVYISVKNYGKDEIKNVSMKVESDLFDGVTEKRNMVAGSTYTLFKKTLTAPYLEEDKKYNIKVSGSYVSSSGRAYTFEKSAQLNVIAPPKIIQIIRELNKEEFYPGDEIKIAIKIKNQKNQTINDVDVSDTFPKEIRSSLVGDVIGYLNELKPNEEKKLYSYSLTIPKDYKEEKIEFKTILNAKVDGELTILKRTDTVNILKGEKPKTVEEEQKIVENETKEEKGEINQTEEIKEIKEPKEVKENFFKKIINWIKNLFKK